ncbi:5-formyltetrahydrofolate cyclo-ligase [Pseudodesulfovibrio sp.]|uniref:5-formyltetrahydrofolate cyclo-ligase n=1 Tax=unclassified Pseudodesulfovibrio TaxID=2661612 RepID=UPI003B003176
MPKDDKQRLRETLLARRQALTPAAVHAASMRVCERIRSLDRWASAREVLIYWPVRGEVDTRPLLADLWARKVTVLMPRCRPDAPGEMDIACATCESDLRPGMFSIMEPAAHSCPAVNRCSPDLALLPGVAFDRHGFRLGFGGGYYDRLMAGADMNDTLTVGLCHAFQLVDRLPIETWDQPVNLICSDEELCRP